MSMYNLHSIDGMIENCSHELDTDLPYVEGAEELRQHDYQPINELLFRFLDRLTS